MWFAMTQGYGNRVTVVWRCGSSIGTSTNPSESSRCQKCSFSERYAHCFSWNQGLSPSHTSCVPFEDSVWQIYVTSPRGFILAPFVLQNFARCTTVKSSLKCFKDLPRPAHKAKHYVEFFCSYCSAGFKGTNSLQQCSLCACARYCSKDCPLNHWDAHKKVCKRLRAMKSQGAVVVAASWARYLCSLKVFAAEPILVPFFLFPVLELRNWGIGWNPRKSYKSASRGA